MITTMLIVLFIGLVLGFPLYVVFSLSGLAAILLYLDLNTVDVIVQVMRGSLLKFALMSVPFFIYTAEVMGRGGLAQRLINWALSIIGFIRGGLAISLVLAAGFMGAISGSAPATVAALGKILYPTMVKEKYGEGFTAGLISSASALSVVIPPSITMIVLASLANLSVGALFIAGLLPAVLFMGAFAVYSYLYYTPARAEGSVYTQKFNVKIVLKSTREAIWALGVPIIILGGIYAGIYTPTEASVIASVYVTLVSVFIYRELDWKEIWSLGKESAMTTAQIFIILSAVTIVSWLLTISGVPIKLTMMVKSLGLSNWQFLLVINFVLLIAGMFLDAIAAMTIMVPLLMPLIDATTIDPIHFGMVVILNLAIGLFTPPFGLNLFVAQGLLNIPTEKIYRGILPYIAISIGILILITYIPEIVLSLPNYLYNLK